MIGRSYILQYYIGVKYNGTFDPIYEAILSGGKLKYIEYIPESANFSMRTFTSSCLYWSIENDTWKSDGCVVWIIYFILISLPINSRRKRLSMIIMNNCQVRNINRTEGEVLNTNLGLGHFSYHAKTAFNNCFTVYVKYSRDFNTFRTCAINSSK